MFPENLFPPLPPAVRKDMADLGPALDAVLPLKARHRADLPGNIRLLSSLLTEDRDDLGRDYMGDPRTLSAYLRYFLPWNLYRLGRLFTGLSLDLSEGATLVDYGSGPLTVPLALWLSRPELRSRRLNVVCVDRTPKPMRSGLDLLRKLAGGEPPWKITLVKGALGMHLRERADLLVLANTLNELAWTRRPDLDEDAARLAATLQKGLAPGGRALLVEPGTREAGRALSALRGACLELGLHPQAPCPHLRRCPMPGREPAPWCHFNFDTTGAPEWLVRLTAKADLTKRNLSLSFLLLTQGFEPEPNRVRGVSEAFDLPLGFRGQYACSAQGLTLLRFPTGERGLPPGRGITATFPDQPERDRKSGAVILPLPGVRS
ncbi:MAG TPA: small ribosomal subunit Rsm22 family protein [Desulfovibrio sp.]|uniref:small ribosomal subunit Rsm22 family protein n=1 Tax=Desulfovibrio sp. TaxID=885 RepID=UPI002D0B5780|nr:small ribosomal subunit Rsm22 family protein [Desulfovibrio sp.]HMM38792.1 small ribosomal subunit Rsm22 family protein [Desulfovibrio sp.]